MDRRQITEEEFQAVQRAINHYDEFKSLESYVNILSYAKLIEHWRARINTIYE